MAPIVIVALFENPDTASSGVMNLNSNNATSANNATRSADNRSEMNSMRVPKRIPINKILSMSIFYILYSFLIAHI